jgi:proteasome-associated ATPase
MNTREIITASIKSLSAHLESLEEAVKERKVEDTLKILKQLREVGDTLAEKVPGFYQVDRETIGALQKALARRKEKIGEAKEMLLTMRAEMGPLMEENAVLRQELRRLSRPPLIYGIFLSTNADGTVNVLSQGRKAEVNLGPAIKPEELKPGQEVVLNEGLNVVRSAGYEIQGEVVVIKDLMEGGTRAIVTVRMDDERVCVIAEPLLNERLKIGDHVMMEPRSGYLLEKLPKSEVEDLMLEEVPDIGYEQIGGLGTQLETIKDAVELPYLYADYYKEHKLTPPKGVLLYGPPGCGKTMIAKAVANNLARQISEKRGEKIKGFFLNVKGPELLNKYVGETERKIREIFIKAKEKANEDVPVVIFFDEMDALFRTRGTGISSDVEATIVPQILVELDGIEGLRNVIVIGASNRQDLIDPAILRPGRLDVKIKIERPDQAAALDIAGKYLTTEVPIAKSELERCGGDPKKTVDDMLRQALEAMYATTDENRFIEVTYANGDKEVLYQKDFSSGAMMESMVRRAKKFAVKRLIKGGEKGITLEDLLFAVREEFKENEDLPNTTNPDDWAKIAGRKGDRIVYVKPLSQEAVKKTKPVVEVNTGQYL